MTYTHRNGETAPPTEPGRYWFNGVFNSKGTYNIVGIVESNQIPGTTYNDVTGEVLKNSDYTGQWWGPMVPPWEVYAKPK
jgi:hypothetical protein